MRSVLKIAAVLLLSPAILTGVAEGGPAAPTQPERRADITLHVDVSGVSDPDLSQSIAGEAFDLRLSFGGTSESFTLRGGESASLPIADGAGELTVELLIPAALIQSCGEPTVTGVWALEGEERGADITGTCDSQGQGESERRGAEERCACGEIRLCTALLLPETGSVGLELKNTVALPEYGSLRIDMSAESGGSFDVLLRLGLGAASPLPVPAGTQYLFLAAASEAWSVRKVESAGVISLAHGEAAMFTKLPAGALWSVRETKNSARSMAVSYICGANDLDAAYEPRLLDDGGAAALTGLIPPDHTGAGAELSSATVTVTIENRPEDSPP